LDTVLELGQNRELQMEMEDVVNTKLEAAWVVAVAMLGIYKLDGVIVCHHGSTALNQ
jgi:hypothetical protein